MTLLVQIFGGLNEFVSRPFADLERRSSREAISLAKKTRRRPVCGRLAAG